MKFRLTFKINYQLSDFNPFSYSGKQLGNYVSCCLNVLPCKTMFIS